jgi:hypothetical protein
LLSCAALLLLASCAKDIQNPEAVRQGVVDYLQQRSGDIGIDMNNIDVKVTTVSFEKDVARASVSFTAKDGPANAGMSMSYVLDRKGDKWAVRGRQSNPANPHGGAPVLPGGEGTPDIQGGPSGPLPSGHPGAGTNP